MGRHTFAPFPSGYIITWFVHKKTGLPFFLRRPGHLEFKIRDFPSPPPGEFGFIGLFYMHLNVA